MKQKNIAFTVDGEAIENRRVFCDASRLSRILLNLVSNAYKFTPAGGSSARPCSRPAAATTSRTTSLPFPIPASA